MRMTIIVCLSFLAAQAHAQCNDNPAPKAAPPQEQLASSPRLQNIEFLKMPEPYNPWRTEDPNSFWFMTDRFSEADLRDLAEFSRQALTPQEINIAGLENRPVDLSLRSQPGPANNGKPLAAAVPPPPPAIVQPKKKSFFQKLFSPAKKAPVPPQAKPQPAK